MKTLRLAAAMALVSSVFALSAAAAEREWWNVNFETASFQAGFEGLTVGELGSLTNNEATMAAGTVQPYDSGVWTAIDSDESYVTNSFNPTNSFGGDYCLRLDTQGNDLTWAPAETTNGVVTLVDADLYLVGSDSAPTDFDANNDVQAAIYLMNQVDDDTQETTNSLLCLYVYNTATLSNVWVELDGVEVEDNSWAHIQVKVDHTDSSQPMVSVKVNDTQMYAFGNATATNWPAANNSTAQTAGKISSVAFRGTGAIDNFVGKTVVEEEEFYTFTAQVLLDNSPVASDVSGNTTRVLPDWKVGTPALFEGFTIDNYQYDEINDVETPATYGLSKIEIYDVTGTMVTNFTYTYDETDGSATPDADDTAYMDFSAGDGSFTVTVPTAGAADDATLAKIYFTSIGGSADPGVVDAGRGLEDYKTAHPGEDVPEPVAFNATTGLFEVSFVPPVAGRYVLITSESLNGPWTEDADSAQTVDAGEPVTLSESTSSSTGKFFKIGFGN